MACWTASGCAVRVIAFADSAADHDPRTGPIRQCQPPSTCSHRRQTGPVADANYLTGLQRAGLAVSTTSFAIASGHNMRGYLAEGHTTEQATSLVMREVPSMASVYAYGMVYSAIAAY